MAVPATLRQLVVDSIRHDVFGLGAELAFRFFLAIFPFFIFLAAIGGALTELVGLPNPAENFVELLSAVMPPSAAEVFAPEIRYVVEATRPGLASFAVLGALLAATSGTNAMIKAMNRAYGVEETRAPWHRYLLAFGLTLLAGGAVIAAFLLFIGGWLFGVQLTQAVGIIDRLAPLVEVIYWPAVAIILVASVAVLYRLAPNVELRLKWVIPGAVVFTLGWLAATAAFAAYVDNVGSYRLTYGALGGVVVLLLWFYVTGIFFVVGAEVNNLVHERLQPLAMEAQRKRSGREAARKLERWGTDSAHARRSA